ncbi:hypothetical protein BD560DRAFT_476197 [Blakeslea trispora]|nr:hypothetical protein BD560DRAFT_476197 [Blakeslea trispora]
MQQQSAEYQIVEYQIVDLQNEGLDRGCSRKKQRNKETNGERRKDYGQPVKEQYNIPFANQHNIAIQYTRLHVLDLDRTLSVLLCINVRPFLKCYRKERGGSETVWQKQQCEDAVRDAMTDDRASDARPQHAFHLILKNCLMAYLLNIEHKINADVLRVISKEDSVLFALSQILSKPHTSQLTRNSTSMSVPASSAQIPTGHAHSVNRSGGVIALSHSDFSPNTRKRGSFAKMD